MFKTISEIFTAMITAEDFDKEADRLVKGGIAKNHEHAMKIIQETVRKQEKADLLLLYTKDDASLVRDSCERSNTELMDEGLYNRSDIFVGYISSGSLGKLKRRKHAIHDRKPAYGKILELISKDDNDDIRLGADIRGFEYDEKKGIYLDPFTVEEISQRRTRSVAEQRNQYHIEVGPVAGDYVFGMFYAWREHPVNEKAGLVLWIPRSKTIIM